MTSKVIDVAVGDHQVGPAVEVGINELRAEPQLGEARFLQSGGIGNVREDAAGQLPVQRVVLVVEIRHEEVDQAVAVGIVRRDTHRGLSLAPRSSASRNDSLFDETRSLRTARCAVEEQKVRGRVVGDEQAQSTRPVEIASDDAHPLPSGA